jgi:hypothetical protein
LYIFIYSFFFDRELRTKLEIEVSPIDKEKKSTHALFTKGTVTQEIKLFSETQKKQTN